MAIMLIDDRDGQERLPALLKPLGVPTCIDRLEYGDIQFLGNGPDGKPVMVGVELKKLADVLQCIHNGRFSGHQLPGLLETYDVPWLLIEGDYRPNWKDGTIQMEYEKNGRRWWGTCYLGRRAFMYRELESWLVTLQMKTKVRVWRTKDREETARWVSTLYHWWVDKEWDEHISHLQFDESRDAMLLRKPTLLRRVAAQLPDIHWVRSKAVAAHFASVDTMINAEEAEWKRIDGIGKGIAAKVYRAIRERVR